MTALVLMDHALLHRAQNAEIKTVTPKIGGSVTVSHTGGRGKPIAKVNPEPHEA
jgi:chorismate synthase